jgi:hypothetical protein
MKRSLIWISSLILLFPVLVLARIGVGVGIGKIVVDQPLKPGLIYTLPSLPVLNTGDEPGEYSISIEYHEGQEQNPEMGLKPQREWFSFEPEKFYLEPGQIQQVKIKLSLPVKGVKPGQYFAYLEGHPIKKSTSGQTTIGVAAAARLYFKVVPANFFAGLYYRIASIFALYYPWSYVCLGVIIVFCLIILFRRFFSFKIGISLKK